MMILSPNMMIRYQGNSTEKRLIGLDNHIVFKSQDIMDFEFYENSMEIYEERVYLAYSKRYGLIYWLNPRDKSIKMQMFNKTSFYHVTDVTSTSRDLLINHDTNVIVWSDVGKEPKLVQMNFDGKQEKVIYKKRPAFHLTIDHQEQLYFFIDITSHSLYSVSYNGHNEKLYFSSFNLFSEMISMFVWNNDLIVANSTKITRIYEIDYKFHQEHKLFDTKYFKVTKFDQIIFENNQLNVTNHCDQANCSELCLPIGHSYRCLCLSGTELVNCGEVREEQDDIASDSTINLVNVTSEKLESYTNQSDLQITSNNNPIKQANYIQDNCILSLISIILSSAFIIMVILIFVW